MASNGLIKASQASWLLLTGLLTLHLLARPTSAQTSFIVKFTPDDADQVEASYKQQGLVIRQRNNKLNFLVVEDPVTSRAVHTAEAQAAAKTRGAARPPSSAAISAARQNRTTWDLPDQNPATLTAAAAVRAIRAASTKLADVEGVIAVQQNPRARRLGRFSAVWTGRGRSSSPASRRLAAVTTRGTCPAETLQTYATDLNYPDLVIGRTSEQVPYGISMVQADYQSMIDISSTYRSKLLFCVIDDGLDVRNPEFAAGSTSGCMPRAVRPITKTTHNCKYPWNQPYGSHGTHTSGTIAAQRSGASSGIVGVAASQAQLYHVNVFGPNDYADASNIMVAWLDCVNELDERKAATNIMDMKLVISMSLGWEGSLPVDSGDVVHDSLAQIVSERPDDILWVAAAGNDGKAMIEFPSGYDEVVSVAAIDETQQHASFSTWNTDVEWAAPGVNVLSTVPLGEAACRSVYNDNVRVITGSSFTNSDMLTSPWPYLIEGSGKSSTGLSAVTAKVVDCQLGLSTCANATGKICLIQLDWATYYCKQVYNCMLDGGIGVLIYHSARRSIIVNKVDTCANQSQLQAECTLPDCTPLAYVNDRSLVYPEKLQTVCPTTPPGGFAWPVAMGLTLRQGTAVKNALITNPNMQLTLDPCGSTTGGQVVGLGFMDGTSMATPAAVGVAGLVWSAHTNCLASEIRAAISSSSKDLYTAGRDEYTGNGLVQAAAAHQYLLAHPCRTEANGSITTGGGSATQMGSAEQWAAAYQGSVDSYLQSYFGSDTTEQYESTMSSCTQEPSLTGTLQRTSSSANIASTCQSGCYSQYKMTLYKGTTCSIALMDPTWGGSGCLKGVGEVTWKGDGTWSSITGMFPANGSGPGSLFTMQYTSGNQATISIFSVDIATPCTAQYTLSAGLMVPVSNAAVVTARVQWLTWAAMLAVATVIRL